MAHPLKITAFEIFEYRLPLKRLFSVIDQPLTVREGAVIRLISDEGSSGAGEAAPLAGLNQETLKKAVFQLNALRAGLIGCDVPQDLSGLRTFFARKMFDEICPSARFALESAVVHVMSQKSGCAAANIFGCAHPQDVPVAGLLQGTLDEIKSQTQRLLGQDCEVFKLKIGNRNIPLDVRKVQLLRDMIGPQKKIRLDANRAWSLTEAVAFAQNIGKEGIEFIEEPLKNISELSSFVRETDLPVAFDESIENIAVDGFVFPRGVCCVVVKPTIVGGILKTLAWIAKAKSEGKGAVVSSSFESGIGMRMLANLATLSPLAAGLGTDQWFAEDLLPPLRGDGLSVVSTSALRWDWNDVHTGLLKV